MEIRPQNIYQLQLPSMFLPHFSHLHPLHLQFLIRKDALINIPVAPPLAVSKNQLPGNLTPAPIKEFQSHSQPCIILQAKKSLRLQKLKPFKGSESEQQTKSYSKKQLQKETRNVASNLLRIFLKNIIELRFYSPIVDKILEHSGNLNTSNQFYEWLQHFNINFKNYIKIGEINKILSCKEPPIFRRIFITLLNQYTHMTGVTHCLTSRRIEKKSIKMHMKGLQDLKRDILSLHHQQKH